MNRMKHRVIQDVCRAVENSDLEAAKQIIETGYPFEPPKPISNQSRKYNETEKTKLFLRDGFIDRYSGEMLVFPPVLRLLSKLMPEEIPYHPNWKMSECHLMYWQLYPTIDHIKPVARGGVNEESNWVCTSQLKNSIKSNWTLEELDW
ncbi:MAG: HNH endonuclease signature motif containing protein [Gimesia sp.]|nr:HNH endonuclease signature motif containing protein [Gimesia sp.]